MLSENTPLTPEEREANQRIHEQVVNAVLSDDISAKTKTIMQHLVISLDYQTVFEVTVTKTVIDEHGKQKEVSFTDSFVLDSMNSEPPSLHDSHNEYLPDRPKVRLSLSNLAR